MASALRISEATSLAMHTMALLAHEPGAALSSREIASRLSVSQAHLQKVLQRLGRTGLVHSERGPGGGFTLARRADTITLRDVYESIEGPLQLGSCLFDRPACDGKQCILGQLLASVNEQFSEYLSRTRLEEFSPAAGAGCEPEKGDDDAHTA